MSLTCLCVLLNNYDILLFVDRPGDKAIIEEYAECMQQWAGRVWKQSLFYADVSEAMKGRGHDFGSNYCLTRFQAITKKFRKKADQLKRSGGGGCSWPLYQVYLDKIGLDNVTVSPKKTVSAGAMSRMEVGGQVAQNSQRATKARPPSESRQKRQVQRLVGCRPIGQRDLQLQMQQKRLQLDEDFVSEFRLFRGDMKERGGQLKEGLDFIRKWKRDNNNQQQEHGGEQE